MSETPIEPHMPSSMARTNAEQLLPLCKPVESELLLATAYRKRIRVAPVGVSNDAAMRFLALLATAEIVPADEMVILWSFQNLGDLLWNRMTQGDQLAWLALAK